MFAGAKVDAESDVIVSWLPCFHDMGMTGYLTVPMYFGVELVKVRSVSSQDGLRSVSDQARRVIHFTTADGPESWAILAEPWLAADCLA